VKPGIRMGLAGADRPPVRIEALDQLIAGLV
jgi:hypothetical protein